MLKVSEAVNQIKIMSDWNDIYEDDDSDTIVKPKTPEQIEADKIAHAKWFAEKGSHRIEGDTFPVKDKLRSVGCKWQSYGKFWEATGDVMFAAATKIVQEHKASVRATAPANPAPLPAFTKAPGGEGEKITVEVTAEKIYDVEKEFNRKKTITTVCRAVDAEGRKFKFNVSDSMGRIETGSTFTLTGTVNDIFESSGEVVTNLLRCKVAGAKKLEPTFTIELFCDAKSRVDGYAVCGADGAVLEYGRAGLPIPDNGDNTDHELFAALRAFEIANEMKKSKGVDCIALTLNFDAQWMKGMVGKAKPLRDFSKSNNLAVTMNHIPGESNPADEWTTASGAKKWIAA